MQILLSYIDTTFPLLADVLVGYFYVFLGFAAHRHGLATVEIKHK